MKDILKFILGIAILFPLCIVVSGLLMLGPWSGLLLIMELVNYLIGNELILVDGSNIIRILAPGFIIGAVVGLIGGGVIIEQEWEELCYKLK